jgi:hypothetical protein
MYEELVCAVWPDDLMVLIVTEQLFNTLFARGFKKMYP